MPRYDISQKREDESIEEYHKRPLFEKPSITKVISRHAGTVLVNEPHVSLTPKETKEFDEGFSAVAKGETSLPLDKFADLLIKLKIKLSKDLYIQLVDENLDELGIEVSERLTKAQCSALYCKVYAAPVKHGPRLRKAAGRNDASIVTSLIARGCDINTADGNGHTPLHHASFHGICRDMIKLLHSLSGKDGCATLVVDAKDNQGWTPLMCAASNGFVDTVKALLDAKASAAETNKEGRNSLHIAASKGMDKVVKMLISPSLVNAKCERGWTPIFDACLHEHEEVIKMLLKGGADSSVQDMLGFTCDHYIDADVWARITKK